MNSEHAGFGAVSSTSSNALFAALAQSRATPPSTIPVTSAAIATTVNTAMAAPTFLPPSQPFKPTGMPVQSPYTPLSMNNINPFERDSNINPIGAVGTPYVTSPASMSQVLIRRLPIDTTEEKLRLMVVFAQDLLDVEMLPVEQSEDPGFRSAVLRFKTLAGAQQTKDMLNGKSITNDVEMIVEVLSGSPIGSRRYPIDHPISTASSAASSTTSSGPTSRQPSRFSGAFQTLDKISPTANGIYGASELPNPESRGHYQSLFSPQSPIGNHLSERTGISGKILISRDEDDETGELLKDPVAFAETNQHRRATAPQLPISRLAALSLNTTSPGPASVPQFGMPTMTPISAQGSAMSPTVMSNVSSQWNYPVHNPHYQRHNFPPVNPADQNPPCNTLYVGNLPIDTSEEELKAMFSKQRGYKRLCFRTKQNGPMCFVEFEDVSFATKALHELYGHPLHNSVKGGIRLSFSKNPLGVRSGQAPGQPGATSMPGMNNIVGSSAGSFTTANGPPPGLAAPPGLNRMAYNGGPAISSGSSTPYSSANYPNGPSNVWNSSYNGSLSANGVSGSSSSYPPAYMMGR